MHIIKILPWIAAIDAFQHWVYENPDHTAAERNAQWNHIFNAFSDNITDWTGYEAAKSHLWQKQLHLFEVPFYYIEYAIAQLGAISIWKNAEENHGQTLKQYLGALELGYTVPINKVYEAAGIPFNFSQPYIRTLAQFIRKKLDAI